MLHGTALPAGPVGHHLKALPVTRKCALRSHPLGSHRQYGTCPFRQFGIDAIEVSGGTPASGEQGPVRTKIKKPEGEAYNLPNARAIREDVNLPLMVVGGIRSYEVASGIVGEGIDYVSLSRPLIREPNLPLRWASGDRAPAKCISCNKCFRPGIKEGGIYCVVEAKERARKGGS